MNQDTRTTQIDGPLFSSKTQKQRYELRHILVCVVLLVEISLMLFYVLLFGLSQSSSHQKAWAQSFVIWLLMDIVLFATVIVVVVNTML